MKATVEDAPDPEFLPNFHTEAPYDVTSETRRSTKHSPARLMNTDAFYSEPRSLPANRGEPGLANQVVSTRSRSGRTREQIASEYQDGPKNVPNLQDSESFDIQDGFARQNYEIAPAQAARVPRPRAETVTTIDRKPAPARESLSAFQQGAYTYDNWVEDDYENARVRYEETARQAAHDRSERQLAQENAVRAEAEATMAAAAAARAQASRFIARHPPPTNPAARRAVSLGHRPKQIQSALAPRGHTTTFEPIGSNAQDPFLQTAAKLPKKEQKDIFYLLPSERAVQAKKKEEEKKEQREEVTPKLPDVLPVFQWPTESTIEAKEIGKKRQAAKTSVPNSPLSPRPPLRRKVSFNMETSDDSIQFLANILDDLHQSILKYPESAIKDSYAASGCSDFSQVEKTFKEFDDINTLSAESEEKKNLMERLEQRRQLVELSKSIFSFFIPLYWEGCKIVDSFWYCTHEILIVSFNPLINQKFLLF
ncbi:hypothetical protein ABW20_dc0109434 [Dactylellina cionopaga]|nr:hypothetical protein ABW20_dc0109434 [Dactylellina cionopaga]